VSGLVAPWLNYGDVDIQTAGESSHSFIIKNAPNPNQIKNLIMELQHKSLNNHTPYPSAGGLV
jgi:hypothetical protein